MKHKRNKIIALPFAGGNRYSFSSIEKYIPQDINWITLEAPGRGKRFTENLFGTVNEIVDDFLDQLIPLIKESDYVIYGHSMGTLLGYELTKKIVQNKLKLPVCLFFTGRGAPSVERFEDKISTLPKVRFWEEVNQLGGFPKEFLESDELLELYYPIMKSDFKAIEDYEFRAMEKSFSIPLHICMGTEEIGEEKDKTSLTSMKAWKNETTSSCTFELLEGDHFFIFKNSEAMARKICQVAVR